MILIIVKFSIIISVMYTVIPLVTQMLQLETK